MEKATKEIVLDVEGMTCASCVRRVEKALESMPGVEEATVNLMARRARVSLDPAGAASPGALVGAVDRIGYEARLHRARIDPAAKRRTRGSVRDDGSPRGRSCRS